MIQWLQGDRMVYILSGIAKAGKTLLSKEIKDRFGLSVFSTDYIMMMVHHGHKELELDVLASDSTVAHVIEPYVRGLIRTFVEMEQDYLVEGVHFNTPFAKELLTTYPDDIKMVYLGYKDITVKEKSEELYRYKETMDNPWIFYHPDGPVEQIVEYMIGECERIHNECNALDIPYFEVSDINTQKEEIYQVLGLLK